VGCAGVPEKYSFFCFGAAQAPQNRFLCKQLGKLNEVSSATINEKEATDW
jgi:hypothetical protein